MTTNPVVAATDGSEESLRAVEWAAREAAVHDLPLRIVSVLALPPRMSPDPAARETVTTVVHRATKRALASAAERASEIEPGLEVGTELLPGPPTQALIGTTSDASMLVVGSRGAGGFSAMVLGSVSRYVATHAACPVVVAREETMAVHRQIVAGVNDPDQAAAALGFTFEEARLHNARLLAVHAVYWSLPPIGSIGSVSRLTQAERAAIDPRDVPAETVERLDRVLAVWRHKYPDVDAGWEVVHAHPARVLAGASARADLVVLGRRASGATVGGITHPVLSHAHGPVAIVPDR
jgi:nucleotide-binding universal stress UspA family protein